ncbi:MAG: hypothetical protein PHS67_00875 [Sphaerochaetaceae bacterium]|jgi:predicted nuclease of restriction endonuclease-like RecB superfamily|nr:hypothetical protein [Sphaerochaetaceae bacterium]MDD4220469.1 hypothetical protein [Sphaerochaetaceae bacterium]MDY0371500.1 hypothetical protein [Sphaerochaetaceae bacterium]
MNQTYSHGVAFILEGDTEARFYETMICHYSGNHTECAYSGWFDNSINDFIYKVDSIQSSVLIRMYNVKTITQIAHSADWFKNECKKRFKDIKWTIFLCYDTDSHARDVTKFYEGDWKRLREKLEGKDIEIIDLAARAMIEDIFLLDPEGICEYLGIQAKSIPRTGSAKKTLKDFFRSHGKTYHEGDRAQDLIWALNKNKIIEKSEIRFSLIEQCCFLEPVGSMT